MIVELRYAGIPRWGIIAVHYWFVTHDSGKRERWEVWQCPNRVPSSVGHLHRNLMHPDSNVGGGPAYLDRYWSGETAQRVSDALLESWEAYPYRERYRALPGPNSNTYVAWVLERTRVRQRLSWRALGRNFI